MPKIKELPKYKLTDELKAHFHEVEQRTAYRVRDMNAKKANDKTDKIELTKGVREYGYECQYFTTKNVDGTYTAKKCQASRQVVKDFIAEHGITDEMLDKLINLETLKAITGLTEDELVDKEYADIDLGQITFTLKKA